MVSQGTDLVFRKALETLPEELSRGLKNAELDDAGVLESYPRDSCGDLVAARVTGVRAASVDVGAGARIAGAVDGGASWCILWFCVSIHCLLYFCSSPSCSFLCSSLLISPGRLLSHTNAVPNRAREFPRRIKHRKLTKSNPTGESLSVQMCDQSKRGVEDSTRKNEDVPGFAVYPLSGAAEKVIDGGPGDRALSSGLSSEAPATSSGFLEVRPVNRHGAE